MKLNSIILDTTSDCNFECDYCYKFKAKKYMDFPLAESSLLFFYPFLLKIRILTSMAENRS